MDDIKSPNTQKPNPAAPEGSEPTSMDEETTPNMHSAAPTPAPVADEEKKGMKGWLVALLVVLALVIGGAGVYLWQTSSSTSDETEQLQAQIDATNAELEAAKKDVADSTNEAKDKEIDTLTAENKVLTDSNAVLQEKLDAWETACGKDPADPTCATTP